MSGVAIEINDETVLGALSRLMEAGGDLRGALQNVGEYERQATIDRIIAEVQPDGEPFEPLSAYYDLTKKGPGILRGETGDLASIVYQLAGDGRSIAIGTNAIYAAVHQFGAIITAKNAEALAFSMGGRNVFVDSVTIPARPFLGLSAADIAEIEAIFLDHIEMAIADEGIPE